MSDAGLTIKIGSTADTRGFDAATEGLTKAEHAAREFIDTLKLGVGIDLGGKLVESVREIPNILREAVAEGIKFNALMQSSQIAIAGGFKSMDSSLTFAEAKGQGGEALDYLTQKSKEMGLDLESVVETFKVNVPTMFQAGIHDAQKMADTIILLNQVARSKGIDGFQAQRDIIDLLNGQGERTILGKELKAQGVTNEALEKAKEEGKLAEFLAEKFAAVAEAGKAAANTYEGALNTLKTTWHQVLGDLSQPVFEELQQAYKDLAAELDSPEGKMGLKTLGIEIKDLVETGVSLTEWAIKNADTLRMIGDAAGLVALTMASIKIVDMIAGFTNMTLRLVAGTTAWEAQTMAIREHTGALEADAMAGKAASAAGGASGGASVAAKAGQGIRGAAAKMMGAVPQIAIAIEVAVALAEGMNWFGDHVYSPAGSMGYGKSTNGLDLDRAQAIMQDHSKESDFQERAKKLTSVEEQGKLGIEVEKERKAAQSQLNNTTLSEGATFDALVGKVKELDNILRMVDSVSTDQLSKNAAEKAAHEKELNDKKAAEEQAAQEAKNVDANKKREEARKEEAAVRDARQKDELAVETAKKASQRGEYSTDISDRVKELQDQQAANPRIEDLKADPKVVAARDKLNNALESQIEQLKKAQIKADEEAWKERDRREQDANREKIQNLQEQIRYEEAATQERLAMIDAAGGKESEIAASRKKVEDDLARKRLGMQDQIGELQGESSLSRDTRHVAASAAQMKRDASADNKKDRPDDFNNYTVERDGSGNVIRMIPLEKKGEVASTVDSERKGYWEASPTSRLPGGASKPGASATATASSSGGAGSSGHPMADAASGVEKVRKTLDDQLHALVAELDKTTATVSKSGEAATRAGAALTKKIDDLTARVDRIART